MGARERIIGATAQLLCTQGLVRTTTKEIARTAGCSEAALYYHFDDKRALLKAVVNERVPDLVEFAIGLPGRAGTAAVTDHLEELVRTVLVFFRQVMPMTATVLADPGLLATQQAHMAEHDVGPHRVFAAVGAYLAAEQRLERIQPVAPIPSVVAMLVGACHTRSFLRHLEPAALEGESEEEFIDGLLEAVAMLLKPASDEPDPRRTPTAHSEPHRRGG